MDQKILLAAAGGIGAAAIALFLILGQGAIRGIFPQSTQAVANSNATIAQDLGITVKNVNVTKQDEKNAKVLLILQVRNPNQSTALLENVHYTVSVGSYQMTSGDTGEVLEGFLGSQATAIPIVPFGNVTIKDEQVSTKNNLTASSWDSMVQGTAKYTIGGWYAVRTTSSLQTNYQEKDFNMTYPASG